MNYDTRSNDLPEIKQCPSHTANLEQAWVGDVVSKFWTELSQPLHDLRSKELRYTESVLDRSVDRSKLPDQVKLLAKEIEHGVLEGDPALIGKGLKMLAAMKNRGPLQAIQASVIEGQVLSDLRTIGYVASISKDGALTVFDERGNGCWDFTINPKGEVFSGGPIWRQQDGTYLNGLVTRYGNWSEQLKRLGETVSINKYQVDGFHY